MKLNPNLHLSYCTNIHAGESWSEVFDSLQAYLPSIKAKVSPNQPFGIGLRLSNQASLEILTENHLDQFKAWLAQNELYVFTMNGFPYGGFHRTVVKEDVHTPDWRTSERLDYTLRLFKILAELLPENTKGGISTSPLSYKFWLKNEQDRENTFRVSAQHLIQVASSLDQVFRQTGQLLHLDIEPEPDGLLENTRETIDFYQKWLIPLAQSSGKFPEGKAEEIVLRHINICYDVCHFAIEYEEPAWVFEMFAKAGIKIGKIQISAALKADLPAPGQRDAIFKAFSTFNESTYLHQVISRNQDGSKTNFSDLPLALAQIENENFEEWRTHFHVPIFVEQYGILSSTQSDIRRTLDLQKINPVTEHLEIETYTWEVTPAHLRLDLRSSIERELEWVIEYLKAV